MGKGKAAKGGANIRNIKAFRQDLLDKQDIKNQSLKDPVNPVILSKKGFFFLRSTVKV
jgi:hypothetical protein